MGYKDLSDTFREHGDRIKVLGSIRHFVAYAGPDSQRFHFSAEVSQRVGLAHSEGSGATSNSTHSQLAGE